MHIIHIITFKKKIVRVYSVYVKQESKHRLEHISNTLNIKIDKKNCLNIYYGHKN